MTHKIGNTVFIAAEGSDECAFCHKQAELRPYGPNNERICFECAMKDKKTTERKFAELIDGKVQ